MSSIAIPVPVPTEPSEALKALNDEQFAALCKTVFVAIPYRPTENITNGLSMNLPAWSRFGMHVCLMKDIFGGFIEITRGYIVKSFMDHAKEHPTCDKLVMIDADETMNWWEPLELALHNLPVVSGVVPGYNSKYGTFACFMANDENGTPRFPVSRAENKMPRSGLKEVHSAGSGLLCVRKDVIQAIYDNCEDPPFFIPNDVRRESVLEGELKLGEDMAFMRQVRECGFPIHVDFGVRAGHVKQLSIAWPDSQLADIDPATWTTRSSDYPGV